MKTIKSIIEKIELDPKHKGDFTAWCKENGFDEVNCKCIEKALKSDDPHVVKMANFARNFAHKECK